MAIAHHHQQLLCGELDTDMKKENFIYSAKDNAIYPVALKQIYVDAGTWPDDGVPITDAMADDFSKRPADKFMVTGEDGLPTWEMEPPLTKEQLIALAETEKLRLIAEVHTETEMLRAKLALGRIKDNEKARLNAWLDYLDELEAVDVSTAPIIIWPVKPAV